MTKKRGDVWYAIFDEDRDENRQRHRRWVSSRRAGFVNTKKGAQIYINEQLAKMARGEYVEPSALTVGAYMRKWLESRKAGVRPSTLHGYRKNAETHIIPRLGSVPVQQLTRERIGAFYAELQDERGLSARSVRHVHTLLRRALRDLVDDHRLARNPAAERIELPKVDEKEMNIWTPADVRVFLDHAREDRLYALWVSALATGARRGELCGLTWRAVDIDAATLTITETLLDVGGKLVGGKPKTSRGRRVVALDPLTVGALRAHSTAQKAERLAFGPGFNERGFVFVREDGSPIHPAWLTRRWSQIVKASGAPRIRLHDARHTSASLALAAGIPIGIVSERLGHSKTSITLDVYAHALPGQHREAADKLADAMFGG
jgi:integrase